MANNILDCQVYNTLLTEVTWETCALRQWLNSDFMDIAFSNAEQKAILDTIVSTSDNVYYCSKGWYSGTGYGGNTTIDKIYLPSIEDVKNIQYGFTDNKKTIIIEGTEYARNQSVACGIFDGGAYWLRTLGSDNTKASFVYKGEIYNGDSTLSQASSYGQDWEIFNDVNSDGIGVFPMLCIDLSKTKVWSNGGKVTSKGGWGDDVKGSKVVVPKNYIIALDDELYYRVTKTGKNKGEVEVAGWDDFLLKFGGEEIEIPKTIKIKGYTYKVTGIADAAFKNCKCVKKMIIGVNVKKLERMLSIIVKS